MKFLASKVTILALSGGLERRGGGGKRRDLQYVKGTGLLIVSFRGLKSIFGSSVIFETIIFMKVSVFTYHTVLEYWYLLGVKTY